MRDAIYNAWTPIMAVAEDTEPEAPPKRSKLPMILGLVLALAGGAGGFYAVQSGLIGGKPDEKAKMPKEEMEPLDEVSFVELPPMVIPIGTRPGMQHLRFRAQLEAHPGYAEDIAKIEPRIVDVLNGYLRAMDVAELADRGTLPKLRAQMLRRVQVVAGKGRVRDLLIMEMVVN